MLFIICGDKLNNEDENLCIKECYKIQDGFIISRKIKNDFPDIISIYDVNKYPLIVKDKSSESRKLLEKVVGDKNIDIKPKYEVTSYWLFERYIKMNKGIGFGILDYLQDELNDGTYLQVPTKEVIPQRAMNCCYLKNSINKSIINKFITTVKEEWKNLKANKH